MSKESPKKLSREQYKRLKRLIELKLDIQTLKELKKSIPPKEKILPS